MTMLDQDVRHAISIFLLIVGALLPIVNPVGSAPMFLALTRGADSATRATLARHIAVNSFMLIVGSLVFGHLVLTLFGLSVPVVQLAGGLVLCWLGANLLTDDDTPAAPVVAMASEVAIARAFYPLTLPLTVDPGAISVAVTLGANHTRDVEAVLAGTVGAVAGVVVIAVSVWLAYRYA